MSRALGDVGGFQRKLDKLVQGGFLSQQNRDVLATALEAGHAVVHRGHKPYKADVDLVFDIVENLLQTIVLQAKSEQLEKRTPRRKKSNEPGRGDVQ